MDRRDEPFNREPKRATASEHSLQVPLHFNHASFFLHPRANGVRCNDFSRSRVDDSCGQIFVGGFGSGIFWRPTFAFDPFNFAVGDTIDVTVLFDRPVIVIADTVEQEAVGVFVSAPSLHLSFNSSVNWNFLDVNGDLFSDHIFIADAGGGSGIGGQSVVDLTDTRFSFQGMHYSIAITTGTGFPAMLNEGAIAIQTQGAILFLSIPEPCTLVTVTIGLVTMSGGGLSRRRHHRGGLDRVNAEH